MKATMIYGAGDIRVENIPDATITHPTDAVVRIVRSCICGSDLWPYGSKSADSTPVTIGHEFLGVVDDIGSQVAGLSKGDLVVSPFVWSDNTCDFCTEGLQTSCRHGGMWNAGDVTGCQAEAVRVPQADGTLVKLPVGADAALLASLLTLSDVYCTGHHCAVTAGVRAGHSVTVIGDGAVGLSAVLAAKQLGAEQIILMGHHRTRTDLGIEFGATDVIAERGDEGVERVRELTRGDGTHAVLECVGLAPAMDTALAIVRDGGTVSRVGAPQYDHIRAGSDVFMRNISITGGVAPARAYIDELMPAIVEGKVQPGKVFDRTLDLDDIAVGYRAMAGREALKVLITT